MRDESAFLTQLFGLDDLLVSRGYPGLSPWWRETLRDFYTSGARQAVIRKGRRVGASTIVGPRVAVCEALHGQHHFSPGDRAVFAFISVRRDEAAKRVRNIEAILDVLQVRYRTSDGVIRLEDWRIDFQVLTASFRTSVGDTCIGVWCDEVARWSDVESGANPAREVLGSLRPTIATLPGARMWLVSSPLTKSDAHYDAFERGSDDFQRCYMGETWTINPTLTEAQCRALEPHEPTFTREYGAVPADGVLESFFGEAAIQLSIDRGRRTPERYLDARVWIGTDAAFARDSFGWSAVTSTRGPVNDLGERPDYRVTRVQAADAWKPDRSPSAMARRLRDEVCQRFGTHKILIDQYSSEAFAELCKQVGLRATTIPWTGGDGETSKSERYRSLRLAMMEGSFRIPDDPQLIRELRSVRSVLTPSGNERIEIPRTAAGHGDRVSAIVLAASEALKKSPELPESDMTQWEKVERSRRQRDLRMMLGSCGSNMVLYATPSSGLPNINSDRDAIAFREQIRNNRFER